MDKVFNIELLKYDAIEKCNKAITLNDTELQDWKQNVEEIALSEYYNLKVKIKRKILK